MIIRKFHEKRHLIEMVTVEKIRDVSSAVNEEEFFLKRASLYKQRVKWSRLLIYKRNCWKCMKFIFKYRSSWIYNTWSYDAYAWIKNSWIKTVKIWRC